MDQIKGNLSNLTGSLTGTLSGIGTLSGYISQGVTSHDYLTGRDLPNQHPIEAITGLAEYIDALQNGFILYCGSATEVI